MEIFFDFLEKISNSLGILSFFVSLIIWYKIYRQNKLIKAASRNIPHLKNFKEIKEHNDNINTINPVAFCLSLIPHQQSIKKDVDDFLKSKGGKYSKMQIIELNFEGISPDNIEEFLNELRMKRSELDAMRATEIHLFIQGPVQAATLVGAILDNWKPVKLYHNNRSTGTYEYWCSLIK